MRKKSLRDLDARGKRVLVREDFNVPLREGRITDDTRIRAALPTIRCLTDQGASVILMSHLGRPRGRVVEDLRLGVVAERLGALLHCPVRMVPTTVSPDAVAAARALRAGDVLLLENVRFQEEEERNDPEFARRLASLADVYVNDAFGSAHRAHASTEGVAHFLPAYSGLLMDAELEALSAAVDHPQRPLAAVIGGAKISSKIGVLRNLVTRADQFFIGGGMANTFLKVQGHSVGNSLVEDDALAIAAGFLDDAGSSGRAVFLPVDVVIAQEVKPGAESRVVPVESVPEEWKIVDIGPETVRRYSAALAGAGTVIWNGPMGIFEVPPFDSGTREIAHVLAEIDGKTVVGGGDSVAAVEQAGLAQRMDHISTGGGASLEFLEGHVLPGVAALADAEDEK